MTFRKLLHAKIHRATITCADLNYEGSLTLSPELLEAAGIVAFEAVQIWNITRGSRVETYAILGTPGSTDICANGAAAHHLFPGDLVIIAAFAYVPQRKIQKHQPKLVFVDAENQIVHIGPEIPGPQRRTPAS